MDATAFKGDHDVWDTGTASRLLRAIEK